ncbi:MAG TPA: CHASE2 domain-containing protein, partial [Chthoniobacterales bacterium]|nr:CHASE2 domain-containing protein [Chthoniobacterales bacterium]
MHWLARHRLVLLGLIAASWTALVALAHFFPSAPFLSGVWNGERSFSDLLRRDGRKTAVHPDFVFVGIDQQSLQPDAVGAEEAAGNRALQLMLQKPYPWSREVWALLMDQLFTSGARLVMFDIVFSSTNEGDAAFHAALDKYRDRVVIGSNINVGRPDLNSKQTTESEANQIMLPNQSLIPAPQGMDDRVGFVNFWRDLDGIVRHVEFHHSDLPAGQRGPNEFIYDSMATRALKKLGRGDSVPNDVDSHAIRFGPEDAYPPHPLYEIFLPKTWHANYQDGAFFKDKIVVVGAAAQIQHDFLATPID